MHTTALRAALALLLAAPATVRAADAPPAPPAEAGTVQSTARASPALVAAPVASVVVAVGPSRDPVLGFLGLAANLLFLGAELDAVSHPPVQSAPFDYHRPGFRQAEARQGFLLSFGLGAGSMNITHPTLGHSGALDLDLRMGWGFSDRFQFFVDLDDSVAHYTRPATGAGTSFDADVSSWTLTFRGQTVLIGDRAGNGLNLNFGVGLGGLTFSDPYGYSYSSTPATLALAGGLSYDFRVGHNFSLSPEFFYSWHRATLDARGDDAVRKVGGRLNFLWYWN